MGVTIQLDDKKVREMLAKAPEQTKLTIRQLLERAGIEVMAEMRQRAPVGVTGDLRRATHYFFEGSGTMIVEPTASYAGYVESGTKPHWISVKDRQSPLVRWAIQKGIPVYALQRSIAKKGTKAHPYVKPTYEAMEQPVIRLFNNGMDDLIGRLNG